MAKIAPKKGNEIRRMSFQSIDEDPLDIDNIDKFQQRRTNCQRILKNDPYLTNGISKDILPKEYRKSLKSTKVVPIISCQKPADRRMTTNYSHLLSQLVVQL